MTDRKYRQRGYQDSPEKDRRRFEGKPRAEETYGPKPLNMPPSRTLSRCAACGAILGGAASPADSCPKCGGAVHACIQCAFFDPGCRFQCSRPITEAITDKNSRNECAQFELKTIVERETSSAQSVSDARSGFDALFKK